MASNFWPFFFFEPCLVLFQFFSFSSSFSATGLSLSDLFCSKTFLHNCLLLLLSLSQMVFKLSHEEERGKREREREREKERAWEREGDEKKLFCDKIFCDGLEKKFDAICCFLFFISRRKFWNLFCDGESLKMNFSSVRTQNAQIVLVLWHFVHRQLAFYSYEATYGPRLCSQLVSILVHNLGSMFSTPRAELISIEQYLVH